MILSGGSAAGDYETARGDRSNPHDNVVKQTMKAYRAVLPAKVTRGDKGEGHHLSSNFDQYKVTDILTENI